MKLELQLRTVTPLFLGGANQEPELRSASVRGMLRYWFRAMMGGVIGHTNLSDLARLEAALFGETERGSALVVRLPSPPRPIPTEYPLLPHRQTAPARAIVETEFRLILSLRPGAAQQKLEVAVWSALLWLTLGGLGRRSRRGMGSLEIVSVQGDALTSLSPECANILQQAATQSADATALAQRIGDLLDHARKAFEQFAGVAQSVHTVTTPSYSILQQDTSIVVWTPEPDALSDPKTAISALMKQMSAEKRRLGDSAFADAYGGIQPRRASSLFATVHVTSNSQCHVVLTHLKAMITPGKVGSPHIVTQFLSADPAATFGLPAPITKVKLS